MSERKLDRSKPFAELFGAGIARFEQDGIQFDQHGNQMPEVDGTPETDAPAGMEAQAELDPASMTGAQLQNEIKRLQGKGMKPGTPHDALVAKVKALREEKKPQA
ncbi:MAG: hypothetical protein AB7I50_23325 [Vicinamibacterales bacterium]